MEEYITFTAAIIIFIALDVGFAVFFLAKAQSFKKLQDGKSLPVQGKVTGITQPNNGNMLRISYEFTSYDGQVVQSSFDISSAFMQLHNYKPGGKIDILLHNEYPSIYVVKDRLPFRIRQYAMVGISLLSSVPLLLITWLLMTPA